MPVSKLDHCVYRRLAVFLRCSDTSSARIRMPNVALEPHCCTKALESLQQRAMKIIVPDKDYLLSLIVASVDMLESRREQLSERFFKRSVLRESSCLHCCRTNGTQPSQSDYVMRKHLHHSPLELKHFASHLYHPV